MSNLQGKVALVTGSSRGIGRGIAIELAKEGALVIINYVKNEEKANEVLEEIKLLGGYAKTLRGDVSTYESAKDLAAEAIKLFGKIDILVNNAGVSNIGLFMDFSKEDIESMMRTNLLGPMYLTKHLLPNMLSKGGNIINISSIWGQMGASCETVYSASKGGLNQFTKSLAKELAMSGIRVNGIAPGVIDTEMNSMFSEEERQGLIDEIPMGRFGLAEEVGRTVVFLCDDRCRYMTGEILKIDGGYI